MYTALYRTYRPETFEEILGQEHIVRILKNQIKTGKVGHAYLFCGTRGTGKTTTARILAKGVNCTSEAEGKPCGKCENCQSIKNGTFIDVIEIDAASNNGVDNIRELRESVKYPPAVGSKKVYIIDEVHMLTSGAFNALLKTLEEPPENVMFILATTEPQKLPATIMSRCMKLDFRRVSERKLIEGMKEICEKEGVSVAEDALKLVAVNADGSVRDGLSILDQCISMGQTEVSRDDVLEFLGASGEETFIELTDFVRFKNTAEALVLVDRVLSDGKEVRQFLKDWMSHYRNLMISKFMKNPEDMLNLSSENAERVAKQSEGMDLAQIREAIIALSEAIADARWSTQPRVLLEMCVVRLSAGAEIPVTAKVEMPQIAEKPQPKPAAKAVQKEKREQVVKEEKEPEAVPEKKEAPPQDFDLAKIWTAVFEEGETAKGSFNLIRTGTRLLAIDDDTFSISASNPSVENYAEKNRTTIEVLMAKHTGKHRKMVINNENSPEKQDGADVEKARMQASQLLGIEVEIK